MSTSDQAQDVAAGKKVATIFVTGNVSATLVIPVALARKHGLTGGTNVVIEDRDGGLWIRRLQI